MKYYELGKDKCPEWVTEDIIKHLIFLDNGFDDHYTCTFAQKGEQLVYRKRQND